MLSSVTVEHFWVQKTRFLSVLRAQISAVAFECFRRYWRGILGVVFRPLLEAFLLLCSTLVRLISKLFCQTLILGLAWLFRVAFDSHFRCYVWCLALEILLRFWTRFAGLAWLFRGLSSYIVSWPRPCYFKPFSCAKTVWELNYQVVIANLVKQGTKPENMQKMLHWYAGKHLKASLQRSGRNSENKFKHGPHKRSKCRFYLVFLWIFGNSDTQTWAIKNGFEADLVALFFFLDWPSGHNQPKTSTNVTRN